MGAILRAFSSMWSMDIVFLVSQGKRITIYRGYQNLDRVLLFAPAFLFLSACEEGVAVGAALFIVPFFLCI